MTQKLEQITDSSDEGIRKLCQEYIDAVVAGECDDRLDDIEHYLFETALEYTFGKQVWPFIREQRKNELWG